MNNINLYNQNGDPNSLQVSSIGDIPAGEFSIVKGQYPFLVKNITQDEVTVQVKLCKMDTYVSTVLYPGWNPELIISIKGVPANTLQYGN